MGKSISHKIIENHLVEGEMITGNEIGIKMDQTLTHDVTGTMAYLGFERLEIPRVKTELSVSYVDHNLLQGDFKNADDHQYLQSIAEKYGIYFSRAGNGICHMIHYQRFGRPGKTLIGSDSHTTTTGAIGMLTMGAGGLDVAMAMAGEPIYIKMPKIVNVKLTGKLKPGVASKDIILELLRRLGVKGGLGKIFEYTGSGVKALDVTQRATITNMGAELGATSSIFPSDEVVHEFFIAQGREEDWIEVVPDEDAEYDEIIEINLSKLEPLVAKPHMPDNVVKAKELKNVKVNQVFIGSCTNASYSDISKAAKILEGKVVHPDVGLSVSVSSRQIFQMLARDGILEKLISSGARIMECGCGACVGIGQAPPTNGVSLRTSNRNFRGRSGTYDAFLYLASPEVAAATAITGRITDPREIFDVSQLEDIKEPKKYIIDDRMIIPPIEDGSDVEIIRGPNIKPMPINEALTNEIKANVAIKVEDNITTDDILPAGATFSSLRSNVPEIAKIVFGRRDPEFVDRAKKYGKSIIVGGENYGQGSSREHAALCPMYLGVKIVLAKSIARIHKNNLINYGILPLLFKNNEDYEKIDSGDEILIENVIEQIKRRKILIRNVTQNTDIEAVMDLSDRQVKVLIAGGQLAYVKDKNK